MTTDIGVISLEDFQKLEKANQDTGEDYIRLFEYKRLKFIETGKEKDILEIKPKDNLICVYIEIWKDLKTKLNAEKDSSKKDTLKNLKRYITKFSDKRDLAQQIIKIQPFFYDKARNWWLWDWDGFKWIRVDDTDILNAVDKEANVNTINSKTKNEIIEVMKQEGRKNIPKEIKKTWIQFKNMIIDVETGEEYKVTPEYFVTNPIPWELNKDKFMETPNMDRIFKEWVGEEYIKTLYQILSYSLLPSYPIHRIFCLSGGGLNGKGSFLRLMEKFLGKENICSSELDVLLTSRFEVTRLHKKLVCQMGETNFNEISKTSMLKKLTGGDLIGFEYKGKDFFEDYNYAKIIISTNNLPTTTDKTIGFYRRWFIIDFPNKFSEKKDILKDIPDEEYCALALKLIYILKDLMEEREFHKEGTIEEREKRYEDRSDPLEKFIKEFTIDEVDGYIFKWEFGKRLEEWCRENKYRVMSEVVIGKKMHEKSIDNGFVMAEWWDSDKQIQIRKQVRAWKGIKWKENQDNQDNHSKYTPDSHVETK